jgi:hypothetical protein
MTIAPHLAGPSIAVQVAVYLGICIVLSAVFYHRKVQHSVSRELDWNTFRAE